MNDQFTWIPFYSELADKLIAYRERQHELFDLIKEISRGQQHLSYFNFQNDAFWSFRDYTMDPFSVMAMMNRQLTTRNRINVAEVLAEAFELSEAIPSDFEGIPVINNMRSFFGGNDAVWELFLQSFDVAGSGILTDSFLDALTKANKHEGAGVASLTMALFWIHPQAFMPLDEKSRSYINSVYDVRFDSKQTVGWAYKAFMESLERRIEEVTPGLTFYQVSQLAELASKKKGNYNTPEEVPLSVVSGEDLASKHQQANQAERHSSIPQNLILYGAPGTGKTYSAILYAVAIVEDKPLEAIQSEAYAEVFKRYIKYKEDGLIAFTTFHQSYSYEEFIEGIRPVVSSEAKADSIREIEYEIHDGLFKAFCDQAGAPKTRDTSSDHNLGIGKAPSVWKISLGGTGENYIRRDCLDNNHIRIGYDELGETLPEVYEPGDRGRNIMNAFYYRMQIGDLVFSSFSNRTIDAIGVVTGEPEWHDEYSSYKRQRAVNWLVKDVEHDIFELNSQKLMMQPTVHKLAISLTDALDLLKQLNPDLFIEGVSNSKHVFIIDEINRGNISKIFGELITLIEPSKRIGASEQTRTILPYSGNRFGVPDNVYLIGTMNTADRSIARIDTALRRRFEFVEMHANPTLLDDVVIDGIHLSELLETMNKRITILLDREHVIGHSFFMGLNRNSNIELLADIFENQIVPLLQEYFYDDYEKIRLVLGDNQKLDPKFCFIIEKNDSNLLFGNAGYDFPTYYEINRAAFREVEAYAYFR